MNVLKAEEMDDLEQFLEFNPDFNSSNFRHLKKFEISYLFRAKKLPFDDFSSLIDFYTRNNLDNNLLINALMRKYSISEKEAKDRLKEVRRIINYKNRDKVLVLKQTK